MKSWCSVRVRFYARDTWVGCYWVPSDECLTCNRYYLLHGNYPPGRHPFRPDGITLYLCLLPMVPIRVQLRWG